MDFKINLIAKRLVPKIQKLGMSDLIISLANNWSTNNVYCM